VRAPFDLEAIDKLSEPEIAAVLARCAARLVQLAEPPAPAPTGKLLTARQRTLLPVAYSTARDSAIQNWINNFLVPLPCYSPVAPR